MAKRQNAARKRRNPIVTAKVNEASLESVLRHAQKENKRLTEEIDRLKCFKQGLETSHNGALAKCLDMEERCAKLEEDKRAVEIALENINAKLCAVTELYEDAQNKLAKKAMELLKSEGAVSALGGQIDRMFAKLIAK